MNTRPLIIAHRGDHSAVPENSLLAFEAAIRRGADMIELDVRCTADGKLAIFHDVRVRGRQVSKLSLAELKRKTNLPMPSLEETLELLTGQVRLVIELKHAAAVTPALQLLTGLNPEQYIVTSLREDVIARVRHEAPTIRAALMVYPWRTGAITRARGLGVEFLGIHFVPAKLGLLQRASGAGLRCLIWTIPNERVFNWYSQDPRVAGLITDWLPEKTA